MVVDVEAIIRPLSKSALSPGTAGQSQADIRSKGMMNALVIRVSLISRVMSFLREMRTLDQIPP